MNNKSHLTPPTDFFNLTPESVLRATEKAGFVTTGLFTQLNSYENRVFDIQILNSDIEEKIIAKFYRPGRWSESTIQEEHDFLAELQDEGIPSLNPIKYNSRKTILNHEGIFVSFFPKFKGRMPEEFLEDDLKQVGRLLAQVHNVGGKKIAENRPFMDSSYHGSWEALGLLQKWIAPEIIDRYNDAAEKILEFIDDEINPDEFIRIHGDCHKGNLLKSKEGFYLVDFDDFCNGPAVQDFWMLFTFDSESYEQEKKLLIEGYETLREFPRHQLDWIDALRGLRVIMYAGWIARRWEDPSFPRLFPEFGSFTYWAEETETLEKIAWKL